MEPTPITVEGAPRPIGPYSHAVAAGPLLFVSGQLALDPATGQMVGSTAAEQLRQALGTMRTILEAQGLGLRALTKTTIFLTCMDDFPACNAVYEQMLDGWKPARSVVEVRRLPKGALVEIEGIAYR